MPNAIALVTVPNIISNSDGAYQRKRGLTVHEVKVETEYTHVSMRQLARLTRGAILAAGIVPQAIRQVDVYAGGRLVVSLAPSFCRGGKVAIEPMACVDSPVSNYPLKARY